MDPDQVGCAVLTELQGQIERVTYTSDESGFTVAKIKVPERQDLITVVGNLLSPTPGEVLRMRGEWVSHPRYGQQFKITECKSTVPATVSGIQKYLGSGLIRGIGPVMAKRIVGKFGKRTLDVIEKSVASLEQVEGIGTKRIGMIKQAWAEQREIREVMLFLQTQGVSSGYATKIFKQYGQRSIEIVKRNPYRLANDIFGIGFLTADRIAGKLGFAKNSPMRAQAGLLYVLQQLSDEGHVYYPHEIFVQRCQDILGVERNVILEALSAVAEEKRITIENLNDRVGTSEGNNKAVYLAKLFHCEKAVAMAIRNLLAAQRAVRSINSAKAIEWVQKQLAFQLAHKQVEAVKYAVENKLLVITGGPGTGKTTIINALLKIYTQLGVRILLAAPTGRAAKRMSEATGRQAKTIHRLLEYSLLKGGFQRDPERPLQCELLVVDETSMIDTVLMYHLLKAVPDGASLILVGDVNQLPSVGPGNSLGDIIGSGSVPVVKLNKIFRQAKESLIIVNAHRINHGLLPKLESSGPRNDFYFIEQEDPDEVLKIVLELARERIPRRFGLDPLEEIQVLTPGHRGTIGAQNLNLRLQETLNPQATFITRGNRQFRLNDKVMQIRNNYDKEVFNGDIGRIQSIDFESQEIIISFDGRRVKYDFTDLDEVVLAYAVSVHKSQGSEFPAVIIPLLTQHYLLLQRNLIYTAVTRGRKLVVMVGTRKALAIAVRNAKSQVRYTRLQQRLAATK
jgi:exodeoxyribonuclease V alpha subunit